MSNTKLVKVSGDIANTATSNRKPPAAGKGRPKGAVNKVNKALKDMILGALHNAGGEEYLTQQAENNPNAFMALVGKVLPVELKNQVEGGITVKIETGVTRD